MVKLVKVISTFEDSKGLVDTSVLEQLIKSGAITAFKRSSGWVRIDCDPIRRNIGTWNLPERRKIVQDTD
jgi:hypothetical protein